MRTLALVEPYCDYCGEQNGYTDMMQLTGREEWDRKANVLYPRYIDVCATCEATMVEMGYTKIRPSRVG